MRQIKFRGKVLHCKSHQANEWVYGMPTIFRDGRTAIRWQCTEKAKDPEAWKTQSVAPETLSQYTGLKDANGVEIYEGDIVMSYVVFTDEEEITREFWRVGEIRYVANSFALTNCTNYDLEDMSLKSDIQPSKATKNSFPAYRSKVIGNIHDNPELIKH